MFYQIKKTIKWSKMSGAGNCFLIKHFAFQKKALKKISKKWVKDICKTYQTDGVVLLFPSSVTPPKYLATLPANPSSSVLSSRMLSADPQTQKVALQKLTSKKASSLTLLPKVWQWLFYNKDATTAEMCGNAACIVVEYLCKKTSVGVPPPASLPVVILKTHRHWVKGFFHLQKPFIVLKNNLSIKGPFKILFENSKISYMFVKGTVPHAVVFYKNLNFNNLSFLCRLARVLRFSTSHSLQGMNVSFYSIKKPGFLMGATFERGVENITPACGTGALAIAKVYQKAYKNCHKIRVKMPGGSLLVKNHTPFEISLHSPVKWVTKY